jgi:hypothetical protein
MNSTGMNMFMVKYLAREKGLCEVKIDSSKKLWWSTFLFRVVILDPIPLQNYCMYTQYYTGHPTIPTDRPPTSPLQPRPVLEIVTMQSHQHTFVGCVWYGPKLTGFPLAAEGIFIQASSLLLCCAL